MIRIGKTVIKPKYFPDGTLNLNYDIPISYYTEDNPVNIFWNFENNEELIILTFLTYHLRDKGIEDIHLAMPYLPNARMDRTQNNDEVFTLKYFCKIINSLNFKMVNILDAHSNVGVALLDRVVDEPPFDYIMEVYSDIVESTGDNPLIFYPDEGAMKRYTKLMLPEYVFGIKKRDWNTGIILGLEVEGNIESIKGQDILIIDDICSKGGTFYYSAKKLKELGAKDIYLYVTHCENSIFDGELLKEENSDLIKKIYTTNSLITKEHKKIKVM